MKALLFAAIAVDLVASLYLALIAPIMITGWNNTTFNGGVALIVTALLAIGIGGPILGVIWRNARPRAALWAAGVPAAVVVAGCIFVTLD